MNQRVQIALVATPDPRIRKPVRGLLAKLTQQIVDQGMLPTAPSLRRVMGGTWGRLTLTGWSGAVEVSERALVANLSYPTRSASRLERFFAQLGKQRNRAVSLTMSNGLKLRARFGHIKGTNLSFGKRTRGTAQLELHNWTLTGRKKARVWVAELQGLSFRDGNLSVFSGGTRSAPVHRALRLEGVYTWHIIPSPDGDGRHVALIDVGRRELNHDSLWSDFTALEFSIGQPLRLGTLVGYDARGKPVAQACFSLGFRSLDSTRRSMPVPDDYVPGGCWVVVLFNRLARRLAADGSVDLVVPIGAFLDAVSEHLDGAYLKLQVAVERFARDLVGNQRRALVSNVDEWRNWVRSLNSEIKKRAVDKEAAGILLGKMIGAREPTTGRYVEAALKTAGIIVGKRIKVEIKERGSVAHRFTMAKRGARRRNVDVDVRRVAVLRTIVTALLALHVGYDGPILGWEQDPHGWPKLPKWWPPTSEPTRTEANIWYICGVYPGDVPPTAKRNLARGTDRSKV
jgi:hypothetical protein